MQSLPATCAPHTCCALTTCPQRAHRRGVKSGNCRLEPLLLRQAPLPARVPLPRACVLRTAHCVLRAAYRVPRILRIAYCVLLLILLLALAVGLRRAELQLHVAVVRRLLLGLGLEP